MSDKLLSDEGRAYMQTVKITNESDLAKIAQSGDFTQHGAVVALGFFDGLHKAHRELIASARAAAKEKNLRLVIFTFSGDDNLLKTNVKKLFTDEEKLSLLEECGADCTVLANFAVFVDLAPESFVKDFLVGSLGANVVVCGYNFRFGKGATGNAETLIKLMKDSGGEARVVEEYTVNGISLSSTYIRNLLSQRRVREAANLLGKPYFLSGKVSHGLGLGKKLGIPTVNLELNPKRFVLPSGVYATVTEIGKDRFPSLTNVGVCPTFDAREIHTETLILNFNNNVYDESIRVYFIDFLRDEEKFSSAEELIMQINVDKNKTLKLFGDIKWQEIGLN